MHQRRQLLAAAAAFAAVASVAPVAASAAPAKASGPKCFGKKPTIVATGSHKTVKGTKKNDVIDALGTGDTVLGLGGNDLICVSNAKKVDAGDGNDKVQFASGTIIGGKGNDTLVQKGKTKGKTVVFGNDGNDTIALSKPNAIVDSGNGLDILTVPPQFLESTTIVDRDGLIVNGVTRRIDAPHGAPTAEIAYNGDPGPVVFAPTVKPTQLLNCCPQGSLSIGHVIPKNGRFLSAWQVNFGDGVVQNGQGGLPSSLFHPFTSDGSHVISATQTDSAGGITTRTITVNTSTAPVVSMGAPVFPAPAPPPLPSTVSVQLPFTLTPGTGATITSWFASFGDGSYAQGVGTPTSPLTHTYASNAVDSYNAVLTVTDDHGNVSSDNQSVSYDASSAATTLSLSAAIDMVNFIPGHDAHGEVPNTPAANPATVLPNQTITLYTIDDGPFDGASLDWGDGCSIDYPFNTNNPVGSCSDAYPFSTEHTHSYNGPGARTITVRLHRDANPANDVVKTWSVNVIARQTVAELSRPGVVQQGPISLSTAGTTVAPGPARWFFYFGDDSEPLFGDGAPPATFSHIYPSGIFYPELDVLDHFGMYSYAEGYVDATSARARWSYFGGGGNARWVPGVQATDGSGNDAVCFSGGFVPSLGAQPKGAQITFGDGASQGAIRGFQDGYFNCEDANHGYTQTGEFTAIVAGIDTKGQVATEREHVSIAGRPTLGFPETLPSATAASLSATTVPVTFNSVAALGANAGPFGWSVNWGDATPSLDTRQGGYGTIPASLSHAYPNPGPSPAQHTYFGSVTVRNDHGGSVTRTFQVTVNGF